MNEHNWKSTEFWMTLLTTILGFLMTTPLADVTQYPTASRVLGVVIAVLAALGYTIGRSAVKVVREREEGRIAAIIHEGQGATPEKMASIRNRIARLLDKAVQTGKMSEDDAAQQLEEANSATFLELMKLILELLIKLL